MVYLKFTRLSIIVLVMLVSADQLGFTDSGNGY